MSEGVSAEIRAYIDVTVMLVIADGEIQDAELNEIASLMAGHAKMSQLDIDDLMGILQGSARHILETGVEAHIQAIGAVLTTLAQRLDALSMAFSVALSDDNFSLEEHATLKLMQQIWHITEEDLRRLRAEYR